MISVAYLLLFLVIGYAVRQKIAQEKSELLSAVVNKFVIYLSLPSLVIVHMADMNIGREFIVPVISAWGMFLFGVIVVIGLSKIFGWSRSITGTLLMIVPFGNTSFMGIPFTKLFFGDAGIPYAVIYDQLGSFLILSTVGILILSIYGRYRVSPRVVLYRLITFPSTIAIVVAFVIDKSMIPNPIMQVLELLASALTPLALIAIGLHLKLKVNKEKITPMVTGLFAKLIAAPAVLLWAFMYLDIEGLGAQVSAFESGMAPMMSSAILAINAGLEKQFIASTLSYGIVASFATLPVVYWLCLNFL